MLWFLVCSLSALFCSLSSLCMFIRNSIRGNISNTFLSSELEITVTQFGFFHKMLRKTRTNFFAKPSVTYSLKSTSLSSNVIFFFFFFAKEFWVHLTTTNYVFAVLKAHSALYILTDSILSYKHLVIHSTDKENRLRDVK